jgi:two-component system sensor histidine kinase UhpB
MRSSIAGVTGRFDARLQALLLRLDPERTLDPAARAEFAQEDRAINFSRAHRWGIPLLALQAVLTTVFANLSVVTDNERLWKRDLVRCELGICVGYVLVLACVGINRGPARTVADRAVPLINLINLFFYALVGINAQRLTGTVGWYIGILFASAYLVRAPTWWLYTVFTLNSALLVGGILIVQSSPAIRVTNVAAVVAVTLFVMVFSQMHRLVLVTEFDLRNQLKHFNAELESRVEVQTRELRGFALRLDEVLEVERRRLAHELHDDLGQEITALRLEVEAMRAYVRDERQLGGLARMAGAIERSHGSVRAILESLRPRILDEEGLERAIHWLGRHLRERTACAVVVEVDLRDEPDAQVGLVAFRVAQESLNNVARHAGATSVSVSLTRRGDALVLEIADDGATDEQGPIRPGRGVAGMRERVSSLGGELWVTAAPTRGTLVRATIPLGATLRGAGASAAS